MGAGRIISERYPYNESKLNWAGTDYEKDVYKIVKLLLEAGTDPNRRWCSANPLPIPTEYFYNKYYEKHGELAINFAIRQNAFTIVELLLEYGAVLDEKSLLNAEKAKQASGGHNDMVEYITSVWQKQRTDNK